MHGGCEVARLQLSIRGCRIRIFARPAPPARCGGDVYFLSRCRGSGIVKAVLADVQGHGAAAGTFGATVREILRAQQHEMAPGAFLGRLDEAWASHAPPYVTVAAMFIDATAGELRWAVAGHPHPVMEPTSGTDLRRLAGGLPLGVAPGSGYPEHRRPWGRRSRVLLYTDGLFPRAGEANTQLALANRLLASDDLAGLVRSADSEDDATLVVIDHGPAQGRDQGHG